VPERKRYKGARAGALTVALTAALLALPGVASANVTATINAAGALSVSSDAGDAIDITCVGTPGNVKVNGNDPAGGPAACSAVTSITVEGGPGGNAINLNGVTDELFTGLTSVTVNGNGGDDVILGSEINDVLNGGDGTDRVVGFRNAAGTRDVMTGGEGNDTLVWNNGDGSDTMDGQNGSDTIEVNGGTAAEQFTIAPSATPGRISFDRVNPGPFNLDIGTSERLDLNANAGDDSLNAAGGAAGLNPFVIDADGGDGNDLLNGGDAADILTGGPGIDRLVAFRNPAGTRDVMAGGEGDDTLVWNNGDGSDTMDGENGNDTVEVNGGTAAEQFTVAPSATPGRISFDRLNPGPFNLDIGTSEKLDLNANAGDDSLNAAGGAAGLNPFTIDADGGDGNDLLNGGDAADILTGGPGIDRLVAFRNPAGTRDVMAGGEGDDTLVWNNGDGSDTMDGQNGNDTVEVNGGTADEEFTVKASATPGRVAFDRVNPGPFNLDIGSSENLQLNAGDGNDEITGAKGLAGLIVSTLNGDDGRDEIKGTDGEDRLNGGKGFDVIRSRDKAEDLVDCGRGFDIAFVDKRDFVRGCEVVLGGRLRVRLARTTMNVAGGAIMMPLRCVVAQRCTGTALLRLKGKSLGKARFNISRKKAKNIRLKLNRRGLRLLADAPPKGLRAQLRIKAKDNRGNGWETRPLIRVKD
jgi:Ca2+-binding RTX toxin-like protein